MTIWLDSDVQWYAIPRGKQVFIDAAILFCLSIKCLFNLALRLRLSFAERVMRLDWRGPDFSTVSSRQNS